MACGAVGGGGPGCRGTAGSAHAQVDLLVRVRAVGGAVHGDDLGLALG